jgi:hypothetical protein
MAMILPQPEPMTLREMARKLQKIVKSETPKGSDKLACFALSQNLTYRLENVSNFVHSVLWNLVQVSSDSLDNKDLIKIRDLLSTALNNEIEVLNILHPYNEEYKKRVRKVEEPRFRTMKPSEEKADLSRMIS